MQIAAVAGTFLAIVCLAAGLVQWRRVARSPLRASLDRLRGAGRPEAVWSPSGPSLADRIFGPIQGRIAKMGVPDDLGQRLQWAGVEMLPERFVAIRYTSIVVGIVLFGVGVGGMLGDPWAMVPFGLLGGVVGWALPDAWLNRQTRQRQALMERELPMFLDLLVTTTQSGVPLETAVRHVAERAPGLLSSTFARAMMIADAGHTLEGALDWAANYLGNRDVESIAQAVAQARHYGTPPSQVLSDISVAVGRERVDKANERAGQVSGLLIFPLVLFIFPATLVILVYPALVTALAMLSL